MISLKLAKNECGVGGDVTLLTLPVRKRRWHGEDTLATNLHADDALVPALNDLSGTKVEGELLQWTC